MNGIRSSELLHTIKKSNGLLSNAGIKPGQILNGKVLRLYPNNRASVQLNGAQLVAQLETPLNAHEKYWFQVQTVDKVLRLKVLGNKSIQKQRLGIDQLLDNLGISQTKSSTTLLAKLMDEKVPFEKEDLHNAIKQLEKHGRNPSTQQLLVEMMKRNLPITPSVFQALSAVNNSDFDDQLFKAAEELYKIDSPSKTQSLLLEKITELISNSISMDPKKQLISQLKQLLQTTGLDHEHRIVNETFTTNEYKIEHTLKSLLLHVLQESGVKNSPKLEGLLHFLNGSQINALQQSDQMITISLQLPGGTFGLKEAIHLDFESYKKENGQINPEFCRILFYLNLKQMNETVIDLNIQKRNVNIVIYNNHPQTHVVTHLLKTKFKEGLANVNYRLSTVQIKPLTQLDNGTSNPHSNKSIRSYTEGVDFRV